MNAKLVNSAAGVIMAALTQNRTAAGIALALDSAQLLLTPDVTAELERLAAQLVEVQAEVSEAKFDAVRACRERDEMRERVAEPYGCTRCGIAKRMHGRRWLTGVGMHGWEAPSQAQIAERMKVRRTVRLAAESVRLRGSLRDACDQIAELESDLAGAMARVAELEAAAKTDGITRRIAPTQALRDPRACQACGDGPDRWCPDCAACKRGCYGGFNKNSCSHAKAPWGGAV